MRRAREHLKVIKDRIRLGTFSFIEEFPDFRDLHKVFHHSPYRTCNQVFDEYLSYCDSRLSKHDLSFATITGYRKVLDSIWRPKLGALPFLQVRYSTLLKIASQYKTWSKKTYNNKIRAAHRPLEPPRLPAFGSRFGSRQWPPRNGPTSTFPSFSPALAGSQARETRCTSRRRPCNTRRKESVWRAADGSQPPSIG